MLALAETIVAINVDGAAQDDREALADFAGPGQRCAGVEAADHAEPPRALDIGRLHGREDLVLPLVEDRRVGLSHDVSQFGVETTSE